MTPAQFTSLAFVLAATLALPITRTHAASLPEFGPSIQFDPAGPQPTVAKLKGKAIIVLFFQSTDKSSTEWSGKLIQEMQEAYGTNKAVVVVALKTDGGGFVGAKNFLASKGANTSQWLIGSDLSAKYSSDLVGDPLWYYVLVGVDGNIVERGKAGITHNVVVGPDKKRESHYSLANPNIIKACGKAKTVLPVGKSYAQSVSNLARLAEMGDTEKALALCAALLANPKERTAATELIADLQPVVEKRLSDRLAILEKATSPSAARYDAFTELAQMFRDLKNHPLAVKLGPALTKATQDPALQSESRADAAYKNIMQRLQKATPRDMPRYAKELDSLSKQYPSTKYGKLAADSAASLAASSTP